MPSTQLYERGTVVRIDITVRDAQYKLKYVDGVNVTIYDSTGATVLSPSAMTLASTGKYYYLYQTSTSMPPGRYGVLVSATLSGLTALKKVDNCFSLAS